MYLLTPFYCVEEKDHLGLDQRTAKVSLGSQVKIMIVSFKNDEPHESTLKPIEECKNNFTLLPIYSSLEKTKKILEAINFKYHVKIEIND